MFHPTNGQHLIFWLLLDAERRHADERQRGEGRRGVHSARVSAREEGSNDLFVEEEERGGVKYKKHATLACHVSMERLRGWHGPAVHHLRGPLVHLILYHIQASLHTAKNQ